MEKPRGSGSLEHSRFAYIAGKAGSVLGSVFRGHGRDLCNCLSFRHVDSHSIEADNKYSEVNNRLKIIF